MGKTGVGIDYSAAKKLIQLAARHKQRGNVLMLGRHKIQIQEKLIPKIDGILEAEGMDFRYKDFAHDTYCEPFFERLGYDSVTAMDMSDYEGAEIVHDLNDPVKKALKGRFDLIYDGGTTEHVFDVATCMKNIFEMLATDGILASCVPANNWFAHGFYQFGPELVYGFWKHSCSCEVLSCFLLPVMPRHKEMALPDPAAKGHRLRMKGKVPEVRTYLYYEVRRTAESHLPRKVLQTDYVAKWSEHEAADGTEDKFQKLRKKHAAKA